MDLVIWSTNFNHPDNEIDSCIESLEKLELYSLINQLSTFSAVFSKGGFKSHQKASSNIKINKSILLKLVNNSLEIIIKYLHNY